MSHPKHPPATVLVVEDEPFIRLAAIADLEDAGFVVVGAEDAEQALLAVNEHPHLTVVFTDIHMPGLCDGLELARLVHQRRPGIRLILTSGKVTPDRKEMPPAAQFLPKPYQGRKLAELVAAA
jgi:DNA-binding NtrC family response regulator